MRKMRWILAAALAMAVGCLIPGSASAEPTAPPTQAPACTGQQFWDVPVSSPFCAQIQWLASTGITDGYQDPGKSDPGFHPTSAVSRQAMAAFLHRYGFADAADPTCAGRFRIFTDVGSGAFCGSVEWLAGAGISTGYADHGFHPTAPVSRQAMAAFLYRFANPGKAAPACTSQRFWDVPASSPFCPQIQWLASKNVTTGYPDPGKSLPGFHPTDPVSRQAMASFLFQANDSGLIPMDRATPLPTVTSVSPSTGPTAGGTVVTVTGTNLTGATKVLFDVPTAAKPAAGTALTAVSSTQLRVTAPAHASGAVPVRVITAAGTSVPGAATFTYPAPDFGIPVDVGDATQLIVVHASTPTATTGTLTAWQQDTNGTWTRTLGPLTAHLGADGIGPASENTQHTPQGTFTLTQAFGVNADPGTALPYFRATTNDWWVSDVNAPTYNTHQICAPGSCPFNESVSEDLGTIVPEYNYAIVMNVNRNPIIKGAGSAFFLHITNGNPTAGCIAIDPTNLLTLLHWLNPTHHPRIATGIS